jgi:DNA phosphorothioation-associated putative methyltransferase
MPFGKKLPTAIYIGRPQPFWEVGAELAAEMKRAEIAAQPDANWNLLKVHTAEAAYTFLTYAEFDHDPHPALAEATKINLRTGSIVRTDYRARANAPILHRKEAFLPPSDPRVPGFAALTKREEEAGLYRDPSRIGLRVQWLLLLKRLGLGYEGHSLISVDKEIAKDADSKTEPVGIERHRTAIKRYDISKPVKQLLERGLLRKTDTFFDYGCGHGMDIEALQSLGYEASGWDPAFRPNAPKTPAAVVNLGYVLNVIEDPAERIATLRDAFSLAERVLLISTMASGQETDSHSRPYRDGFLTKTNTFQKFYTPGELEGLIEQALDVEASTLCLGICVVFRSDEDAELFESNRNRRRIDWTEISAHLKFSATTSRERRSVDRYELNKELFDQLWHRILELGRAPEPGEFDRLTEVTKAAGGIKRALDFVVTRNGEQLWKTVCRSRAEDVLVYLAMSKFRKGFLRREIPPRIRNDIRSFFGDLPSAQAQALELLFAAGDPGEINVACEGVDVGWQDKDSLMIHRSLLGELPPILRIFVHCAAFRYGDPAQADVIKIHKHSGKITFQHYDDFDGKPLPELRTRIKVNLRTLLAEVFDHSKGPRIQLLYFKERFVGKTHPGRSGMEKFSSKLRKLGLTETSIGLGPDKESFIQVLAEAGLDERLRPKRQHSV